jgi:hypothetical protein
LIPGKKLVAIGGIVKDAVGESSAVRSPAMVARSDQFLFRVES